MVVFLQACSRTKMFTKFEKRVIFQDGVLEILKKGYFAKRVLLGKEMIKNCVCLCSWNVKEGCFSKNALETLKIGVFFPTNLYPLLCKIGVKIKESELETTRNRGYFLPSEWSCVTPFEYKVTPPWDPTRDCYFYQVGISPGKCESPLRGEVL